MRTRMLAIASGAVAALLVSSASHARAQQAMDEEAVGTSTESAAPGARGPFRLLFGLGAQIGVRLLKYDGAGDSKLTPFGLQADLGLVLPGGDHLRHAFVISVTTNLQSDGPTAPGSQSPDVSSLGQWGFTPSYLLYYRLDRDLLLDGRVGIPIFPAPDPVVGLEVGGGAAYYLTAGIAGWAQITADIYRGERSRFHPVIGATLGILIDYEVLP